MKTKIPLTTFLLCFGIIQSISAQNMLLQKTDNSTDIYAINNIKKITYDNNNVSINLTSGTTEVKDITTISQITFDNIITTINKESESVGTISFYPNPSKDEISFNYTLKSESPVLIEVYSVKGELVKKINLGKLPTGNHTYKLNVADFPLNGTYFCKVFMTNEVVTKKIIIIK